MSESMTQLRQYLSDNPQFKSAFEASFRRAKATGIPQFEEYGIQAFDQYIDYYGTLVDWTPTENVQGMNIYHRICLFYVVIDLWPVNEWQSPIDPCSVPPWKWLSNWLIAYSKEMGCNMCKPHSLTTNSLETFYSAAKYHMQDYPVPLGGWKNFNEFFARKINLDLRPIDPHPYSIVSPADATFCGSWDVTPDSTVVVKGVTWRISELLRGSKYAHNFRGGKFTHSALAPWDYHRQHTPVAGKVVEMKNIEGLCYLQVGVRDDPSTGTSVLEMKRDLLAPDSVGHQFLQSRGLMILENPIFGFVAVLPIGMAQISSVVFTVSDNGHPALGKGAEFSYFQFGGSDIVCIFEARANAAFTAELNKHYNVGHQIAVAHPCPNRPRATDHM